MCNALSQNLSVYFKLLYSKCAQNHMTSGVSFYVLSMKWRLRCPQPASETSVSRWQRCTKPFMNFYLKNRHRWDLFVFSTPYLWQLVDQRLESCVSIYRCCFWGSMPVSKCIWRGSWLGLELLMMEDRSMGKCPENQLMIGVCWYDRAALPASLWREVAPLFLLVFPVISHFIEREFWTLHEYLTCLYICYIKVLELYLTNLTQI